MVASCFGVTSFRRVQYSTRSSTPRCPPSAQPMLATQRVNGKPRLLSDSKSRGFPFTRWVANMGWALGGHRGVEDLVEYCTRLNDVTPKHEATIVCTYDLAQFSATSV